MTTDHALWPGRGFSVAARPDVQAKPCMRDRLDEVKVASGAADFARNQHGNLADERTAWWGPSAAPTRRGPNPKAPAGSRVAASPAAVTTAAPAPTAPPGRMAGIDARPPRRWPASTPAPPAMASFRKIVGRAFFAEIAKRHAGRVDYLAGKSSPAARGCGVPFWHARAKPERGEARVLAAWIAAGAPK